MGTSTMRIVRRLSVALKSPFVLFVTVVRPVKNGWRTPRQSADVKETFSTSETPSPVDVKPLAYVDQKEVLSAATHRIVTTSIDIKERPSTSTPSLVDLKESAVDSRGNEVLSPAAKPIATTSVASGDPSTTVEAEPEIKEVRTFHSTPTSGYILPSDEQERQRLQLQHEVLRKAQDDRLVLAPLRLASIEGAQVLDSGTGSAAWALDLAREVPSTVSIYGMDMERRLFPRPSPYPNLTFSTGNVLSIDESWSNKFDLVHQRLLIAALRSSEWPTALNELKRVLKPGGWIQLGEAGTWRGGEVTKRHHEMLYKLFSARGLLLDISSDLPRLLTEAGFEDIRVDRRVLPMGAWGGPEAAHVRDNFMGVFRGMKTAVLRSGGFGYVQNEEELDKMLDDLEKEFDMHNGTEMEFYEFCARKPLEALVSA